MPFLRVFLNPFLGGSQCFSGGDMTGRPGHRTMEMNGKSTVSYLMRTPRVPFFMLILVGLEAKNLLVFQGRRGIASVVRWNLRPVIFGVVFRTPDSRGFRHFHGFHDFRFSGPAPSCCGCLCHFCGPRVRRLPDKLVNSSHLLSFLDT